MNKISVTTKLTFEEFRKANFYFLYRKWAAKFSLVMGTFILIGTLVFYFMNPSFYTQFPVIPVLLGLMMAVFPPYSIFRTAKKNYNSNGRISETISYEFDDDVIQISGESFHSKLTWDKIYELTVTRSWVLVWQSGQVANVIPTKDITPNQIQQLKKIVEKYPSIKRKY
jgi:hypothetical protein